MTIPFAVQASRGYPWIFLQIRKNLVSCIVLSYESSGFALEAKSAWKVAISSLLLFSTIRADGKLSWLLANRFTENLLMAYINYYYWLFLINLKIKKGDLILNPTHYEYKKSLIFSTMKLHKASTVLKYYVVLALTGSIFYMCLLFFLCWFHELLMHLPSLFKSICDNPVHFLYQIFLYGYMTL